VSEDVAIPTVNRPDRLDLDATPSWKGVLEALPRPARDPSVGAIVVTVGTARSAWVAPIFSDSWALTATIPLPAPVTVAVLEAISNIPFPPASRSFMAIRALVLDRRGFNPDPPFSGCTSVDTLRARSWATSALCHRRRALPVRGAELQSQTTGNLRISTAQGLLGRYLRFFSLRRNPDLRMRQLDAQGPLFSDTLQPGKRASRQRQAIRKDLLTFC
jgi:hypothetical protein